MMKNSTKNDVLERTSLRNKCAFGKNLSRICKLCSGGVQIRVAFGFPGVTHAFEQTLWLSSLVPPSCLEYLVFINPVDELYFGSSRSFPVSVCRLFPHRHVGPRLRILELKDEGLSSRDHLTAVYRSGIRNNKTFSAQRRSGSSDKELLLFCSNLLESWGNKWGFLPSAVTKAPSRLLCK